MSAKTFFGFFVKGFCCKLTPFLYFDNNNKQQKLYNFLAFCVAFFEETANKSPKVQYSNTNEEILITSADTHFKVSDIQETFKCVIFEVIKCKVYLDFKRCITNTGYTRLHNTVYTRLHNTVYRVGHSFPYEY